MILTLHDDPLHFFTVEKSVKKICNFIFHLLKLVIDCVFVRIVLDFSCVPDKKDLSIYGSKTFLDL